MVDMGSRQSTSSDQDPSRRGGSGGIIPRTFTPTISEAHQEPHWEWQPYEAAFQPHRSPGFNLVYSNLWQDSWTQQRPTVEFTSLIIDRDNYTDFAAEKWTIILVDLRGRDFCTLILRRLLAAFHPAIFPLVPAPRSDNRAFRVYVFGSLFMSSSAHKSGSDRPVETSYLSVDDFPLYIYCSSVP